MQTIPAWVKVDHNSYNAKLRGIYKNVRENEISAACEQAKRLYMDLLMEMEMRGIQTSEKPETAANSPRPETETANARA
ncbi:hypothetical protein QWJ34_23145 [Saccharibacillus sp. CPCC 101409]|uniref:hypothetical protein n=1 Tax=Saccharibacillus sp. CPCC 101409 TaxID=3058041 RepID=UPI002672C41E|nr:hypothetical protein [Saccharibacillus sp. CPCC 101409]MDO3412682.1 hypothetical protein [Saccharibacillus sp. CPCC 101409]